MSRLFRKHPAAPGMRGCEKNTPQLDGWHVECVIEKVPTLALRYASFLKAKSYHGESLVEAPLQPPLNLDPPHPSLASPLTTPSPSLSSFTISLLAFTAVFLPYTSLLFLTFFLSFLSCSCLFLLPQLLLFLPSLLLLLLILSLCFLLLFLLLQSPHSFLSSISPLPSSSSSFPPHFLFPSQNWSCSLCFIFPFFLIF